MMKVMLGTRLTLLPLGNLTILRNSSCRTEVSIFCSTQHTRRHRHSPALVFPAAHRGASQTYRSFGTDDRLRRRSSQPDVGVRVCMHVAHAASQRSDGHGHVQLACSEGPRQFGGQASVGLGTSVASTRTAMARHPRVHTRVDKPVHTHLGLLDRSVGDRGVQYRGNEVVLALLVLHQTNGDGHGACSKRTEVLPPHEAIHKQRLGGAYSSGRHRLAVIATPTSCGSSSGIGSGSGRLHAVCTTRGAGQRGFVEAWASCDAHTLDG